MVGSIQDPDSPFDIDPSKFHVAPGWGDRVRTGWGDRVRNIGSTLRNNKLVTGATALAAGATAFFTGGLSLGGLALGAGAGAGAGAAAGGTCKVAQKIFSSKPLNQVLKENIDKNCQDAGCSDVDPINLLTRRSFFLYTELKQKQSRKKIIQKAKVTLDGIEKAFRLDKISEAKETIASQSKSSEEEKAKRESNILLDKWHARLETLLSRPLKKDQVSRMSLGDAAKALGNQLLDFRKQLKHYLICAEGAKPSSRAELKEAHKNLCYMLLHDNKQGNYRGLISLLSAFRHSEEPGYFNNLFSTILSQGMQQVKEASHELLVDTIGASPFDESTVFPLDTDKVFDPPWEKLENGKSKCHHDRYHQGFISDLNAMRRLLIDGTWNSNTTIALISMLHRAIENADKNAVFLPHLRDCLERISSASEFSNEKMKAENATVLRDALNDLQLLALRFPLNVLGFELNLPIPSAKVPSTNGSSQYKPINSIETVEKMGAIIAPDTNELTEEENTSEGILDANLDRDVKMISQGFLLESVYTFYQSRVAELPSFQELLREAQIDSLKDPSSFGKQITSFKARIRSYISSSKTLPFWKRWIYRFTLPWSVGFIRSTIQRVGRNIQSYFIDKLNKGLNPLTLISEMTTNFRDALVKYAKTTGSVGANGRLPPNRETFLELQLLGDEKAQKTFYRDIGKVVTDKFLFSFTSISGKMENWKSSLEDWSDNIKSNVLRFFAKLFISWPICSWLFITKILVIKPFIEFPINFIFKRVCNYILGKTNCIQNMIDNSINSFINENDTENFDRIILQSLRQLWKELQSTSEEGAAAAQPVKKEIKDAVETCLKGLVTTMQLDQTQGKDELKRILTNNQGRDFLSDQVYKLFDKHAAPKIIEAVAILVARSYEIFMSKNNVKKQIHFALEKTAESIISPPYKEDLSKKNRSTSLFEEGHIDSPQKMSQSRIEAINQFKAILDLILDLTIKKFNEQDNTPQLTNIHMERVKEKILGSESAGEGLLSGWKSQLQSFEGLHFEEKVEALKKLGSDLNWLAGVFNYDLRLLNQKSASSRNMAYQKMLAPFLKELKGFYKLFANLQDLSIKKHSLANIVSKKERASRYIQAITSNWNTICELAEKSSKPLSLEETLKILEQNFFIHPPHEGDTPHKRILRFLTALKRSPVGLQNPRSTEDIWKKLTNKGHYAATPYPIGDHLSLLQDLNAIIESELSPQLEEASKRLNEDFNDKENPIRLFRPWKALEKTALKVPPLCIDCADNANKFREFKSYIESIEMLTSQIATNQSSNPPLFTASQIREMRTTIRSQISSLEIRLRAEVDENARMQPEHLLTQLQTLKSQMIDLTTGASSIITPFKENIAILTNSLRKHLLDTPREETRLFLEKTQNSLDSLNQALTFNVHTEKDRQIEAGLFNELGFSQTMKHLQKKLTHRMDQRLEKLEIYCQNLKPTGEVPTNSQIPFIWNIKAEMSKILFSIAELLRDTYGKKLPIQALVRALLEQLLLTKDK